MIQKYLREDEEPGIGSAVTLLIADPQTTINITLNKDEG